MHPYARDSAYQQLLWEHLEPSGLLTSWRRTTLIYNPTQPAHVLYLLRSGQVSLQLIAASGRVLTLRVIEPGQLFGHSALLGSSTYDTFAETTRAAEAVTVARASVLQAIERTPALGLHLLEDVGYHRLTISRRLDEVAFKSVPARLASLLLDMAGTMAGAVADEQQLRLPRRTHQQLAEMINAYRETVTKVINQFQAARLLDMDRSGITLLNLSGLRELAQS